MPLTIFIKHFIVPVWQSSEYASAAGSGYTSALNTSLVFKVAWFWIYQGYTGFWICLNMPDYAWIFQSMSEYGWMTFVLQFPIVILAYLTLGYLFQRLHETSYSLMEHEAVFLMSQNLIFSIVVESIWFVFCFWQNIFKRDSKFDFTLGTGYGAGPLDPDIPFEGCVLLVKTCKEMM